MRGSVALWMKGGLFLLSLSCYHQCDGDIIIVVCVSINRAGSGDGSFNFMPNFSQQRGIDAAPAAPAAPPDTQKDELLTDAEERARRLGHSNRWLQSNKQSMSAR